MTALAMRSVQAAEPCQVILLTQPVDLSPRPTTGMSVSHAWLNKMILKSDSDSECYIIVSAVPISLVFKFCFG